MSELAQQIADKHDLNGSEREIYFKYLTLSHGSELNSQKRSAGIDTEQEHDYDLELWQMGQEGTITPKVAQALEEYFIAQLDSLGYKSAK